MKLFYTIFILFSLLISCTSTPVQNTSPASTPSSSEGFLNINGVDLYYKIIGEGEPMIVVHGGPGLDQSYLLPQMEVLAKDYQLIFFDQRLSGKSSSKVAPDSISIQNFVEDIEGLRQKLNLGKVHLFTHSWGGLLGMYYGMKYSEQLHSLILLSPMAPNTDMFYQAYYAVRSKDSPEDSLALVEIEASEAFQNGDVAANENYYRTYFRADFHNKHFADSLTITFPKNFAQNTLLLDPIWVEFDNFNIFPDLHKISCPTLLLLGADEPLVAIAGDSLHTKIPNSTYEVIPNCGHFAYIEAQEEFLRLVRAFKGNL